MTCRFENFESAAHAVCRHTTNYARSLFNKNINLCTVCSWDLCLQLHFTCSCTAVARAHTQLPHDNRHWTCKRLLPDSIRDSIRTEISDSQVLWHIPICTASGACGKKWYLYMTGAYILPGGVSWAPKICMSGQSMFRPPPQKVTFFHTRLLLDNSASFTSSRMKNLCQKWKVKLISRGAYTGCQEPGLLSVWKS